LKADDVLLALVAFGAVVAVGSWYLKKQGGGATSFFTPGPAGATALVGAGGPYAGGSYFTPEQQAVWAVPDNQLPAWGDL
jgi:hypothetical protein